MQPVVPLGAERRLPAEEAQRIRARYGCFRDWLRTPRVKSTGFVQPVRAARSDRSPARPLPPSVTWAVCAGFDADRLAERPDARRAFGSGLAETSAGRPPERLLEREPALRIGRRLLIEEDGATPPRMPGSSRCRSNSWFGTGRLPMRYCPSTRAYGLAWIVGDFRQRLLIGERIGVVSQDEDKPGLVVLRDRECPVRAGAVLSAVASLWETLLRRHPGC